MLAANWIILCVWLYSWGEYVLPHTRFPRRIGGQSWQYCFAFFLYPTSVLVLDPLSSSQCLVYEITWQCRSSFLLEQNTQHSRDIAVLPSAISDVRMGLSVTFEGVLNYDSFLKLSCLVVSRGHRVTEKLDYATVFFCHGVLLGQINDTLNIFTFITEN